MLMSTSFSVPSCYPQGTFGGMKCHSLQHFLLHMGAICITVCLQSEMLAAGVLFLMMRKEEHELCCLLIISCEIKLCCSLVWH